MLDCLSPFHRFCGLHTLQNFSRTPCSQNIGHSKVLQVLQNSWRPTVIVRLSTSASPRSLRARKTARQNTATMPSQQLNHQAREQEKIEKYFNRKLLKDVTREQCDRKAEELCGPPINSVAVQGLCSYTVIAGPDQDKIVNFREETISEVDLACVERAWEIHGNVVPRCTARGSIGPLKILEMPKLKGQAQSDAAYKLPGPLPPQALNQTQETTRDIARFMAASWKGRNKGHQDMTRVTELRDFVTKEIRAFAQTLPERHKDLLVKLEKLLPHAFENDYPMVLTHLDLLPWNILVDSGGSVTGVIDWWDAQVMPFGVALQGFFFTCLGYMDDVDDTKVWSLYEEHVELEELFWNAFAKATDSDAMQESDFAGMTVAQLMGYYLRYGSTWDEGLGEAGAYRPSRDGDEKMVYLDAVVGWTYKHQDLLEGLLLN